MIKNGEPQNSQIQPNQIQKFLAVMLGKEDGMPPGFLGNSEPSWKTAADYIAGLPSRSADKH